MLIDSRDRPIFPRWLGYVNLWLALMFTPASFLVFFKTGPLAWNGLLVWWVPVAVFLLWFVPNFVFLLRAVSADDGEPDHSRIEREVAELRTWVDAMARPR